MPTSPHPSSAARRAAPRRGPGSWQGQAPSRARRSLSAVRALPIAGAMRRSTKIFSRRYAVAWVFLGIYGVSAAVYTLLPPHAQAVVVAWSSTNVDNLRADPAGSLVASAFIPGQPVLGWLGLIILAIFIANRLLGNLRAAVLVGAGHVIGTLVSEGILAARVAGGSLPQSDRLIVDVGPSYVVVSALAAVMLYGTWPYAIAAGASFGGLAGEIFGGLSHLDVSAVGHLTALVTGVVLGGLLLRRARGRPVPVPASVQDLAPGPVPGPAPGRLPGLASEPVPGAELRYQPAQAN
jgi:rhomboid family protein